MKIVLVANRGAIAVRVIRTLKRLGIRSVAVFHEHDRASRHVSDADYAVSLGDGSAAETYLNASLILEIAKQVGADAIHPGYGFLSENADFVRACEKARVLFLGPRAEQIEAFGYKHAARALASENDVPLIRGSDLVNSGEEAVSVAKFVGAPVILKSTAGGGGIGMRVCLSLEEVESAYESVARLAQANFGDARIFLEKYIVHARHIEVQVFGDGRGGVAVIGERDCSVQRRNQKIIEEAPAPNLPEPVRQAMHAAARRLCESVQYRSAGTVEFLYDADTKEFYFLEVNSRIQVEHGVTEQVFGIDLIEWMIRLGESPDLNLEGLVAAASRPKGWSIQARIYAEDPGADFRPCPGTITHIELPEADGRELRIDQWVSKGVTVSPLFDPMIGKVIAWGKSREEAMGRLDDALCKTTIFGVETNIDYARAVLASALFQVGTPTTAMLQHLAFDDPRISVLEGGAQTTVQDLPGRVGYWDVGVPPSGPMDSLSFELGNRAVGNAPGAAGLEIVLKGPTLRFRCAATVILTGAPFRAMLNGKPIEFWSPIGISAGDVVEIGEAMGPGRRCYLLVRGGVESPVYLGSQSTFVLGKFGGPFGRALRTSDVLRIGAATDSPPKAVPAGERPEITRAWDMRVMYGPHGAPDFFTEQDMAGIFSADWEVHFNSDRTGVRLKGPKPDWARVDGGEAGLHPSNLHDNAYAIGSMDFTGDMPVLIGPDGPSLGGFVCPAVIIAADLWKLGQLAPGDKVRFRPVEMETARAARPGGASTPAGSINAPIASPIIMSSGGEVEMTRLVVRQAGDSNVLVEFGPNVLDLELRFKAQQLLAWLEARAPAGITSMTPGIRSLQIAFDNSRISRSGVIDLIEKASIDLRSQKQTSIPSRIVRLPLAWNDSQTRLAIEKYMATVRPGAPWGPSNIEFIRRINGLPDEDAVKDIVYSASYFVMGLGDVYLGAPVATPYDPRHRLVTTKYNPARTWTPENAVGIGGSYMCIYGMEGPGGYQFVGRTLPIWNRVESHPAFEADKPWLLRFFDQIQYEEVSEPDLLDARRDFTMGRYSVDIQESEFDLREYQSFLRENAGSIEDFRRKRQSAFEEERRRWIESGDANFRIEDGALSRSRPPGDLPDGQEPIVSTVSGSVWKILKSAGDAVEAGEPVAILESMKMEFPLVSPRDGEVAAIWSREGAVVDAGTPIVALREIA